MSVTRPLLVAALAAWYSAVPGAAERAVATFAASPGQPISHAAESLAAAGYRQYRTFVAADGSERVAFVKKRDALSVVVMLSHRESTIYEVRLAIAGLVESDRDDLVASLVAGYSDSYGAFAVRARSPECEEMVWVEREAPRRLLGVCAVDADKITVSWWLDS